MRSSSLSGRVERSRPLLGTLVDVSCHGLEVDRAHRGIDAAFAAIADVHRLMSFHEPASDVSRLNHAAAAGPVEVDPLTFGVLSRALELSGESAGVFDITVAGQLVASGVLPRPPGAPDADPAACWRDVELLPEGRVRFHRPLWIDLGGIAKGFAVDRAMERIADDPAVRWIVNAGGDLRVAGDGVEPVLLQTELPGDAAAPVIELANASLASSTGRGRLASAAAMAAAPHLDGRLRPDGARRSVGAASFACVVARECIVADALTKVVLALEEGAEWSLRRHGATAFLQDAGGAWRQLGEGA